MLAPERSDFRDMVIEACGHVLPQCGLPIVREPADLALPVDPDELLAAFIGFSSESVRGSVILLVPTVLAKASYPLKLRTGIQEKLELFDWCGEIVNRLLGRIKSGLGKRGVEVDPSTPKTMMGEQIQLVVAEQSAICALSFGCGTGTLSVIVDAIAAGDKPVFLPADDAQTSQAEGELLLF
jgi:hypothetical protein